MEKMRENLKKCDKNPAPIFITNNINKMPFAHLKLNHDQTDKRQTVFGIMALSGILYTHGCMERHVHHIQSFNERGKSRTLFILLVLIGFEIGYNDIRNCDKVTKSIIPIFEKNKAGYSTTPLACGWAGAVVEVT